MLLILDTLAGRLFFAKACLLLRILRRFIEWNKDVDCPNRHRKRLLLYAFAADDPQVGPWQWEELWRKKLEYIRSQCKAMYLTNRRQNPIGTLAYCIACTPDYFCTYYSAIIHMDWFCYCSLFRSGWPRSISEHIMNSAVKRSRHRTHGREQTQTHTDHQHTYRYPNTYKPVVQTQPSSQTRWLLCIPTTEKVPNARNLIFLQLFSCPRNTLLPIRSQQTSSFYSFSNLTYFAFQRYPTIHRFAVELMSPESV